MLPRRPRRDESFLLVPFFTQVDYFIALKRPVPETVSSGKPQEAGCFKRGMPPHLRDEDGSTTEVIGGKPAVANRKGSLVTSRTLGKGGKAVVIPKLVARIFSSVTTI